LKGLAFIAAGVCTLAFAGAATPAPKRILTLNLGDKVTLPGTSLRCAVQKVRGEPAAICFKLAANKIDVGSYSLVVWDSFAVVGRYTDRTGRNKAVFLKPEPHVNSALFGGAGTGGKTVALKIGDIARIAGSHVVIAAEPNNKKQATLGALLADRTLTPVAGSYGGGVSETEVVLAVVTKSGSSIPIFRRTHGH
jgi:hypothetical protein